MIFKRQPKDPNERVDADLKVLRQQHRENEQRRVGLTNMPKYLRAKQDLVGMGVDAVPALIEVLSGPRPSTDTPAGLVENGVANDIADVLGEIGDPRSVEPLLAQFKNYIVTAHSALAKFPEGIDALLNGLDDPNEFIRGCCAQGLGFVTLDRARAASGIAKALDDTSADPREQAVLAARHLGIADPQVIGALERCAADDPSDRVRGKAQDVLGELTRPQPTAPPN